MSAVVPPSVYLDECVDINLLLPLLQRGFTLSHASIEGRRGLDDEAQLDYAVQRGWSILSHNKADFRRLHRAWQVAGRLHQGILIIPQRGPPAQTELRIAMMLTWVQQESIPLAGEFWLWNDVQQWLAHGGILAGFTAEEVQLALGRIP